MRIAVFAAALVMGGVAAFLPPAGRHAERPPPAHTGGFGEPTCTSCHFDAGPFERPGAVTLEIERSWTPKSASPGRILLHSPGMLRAGFQLSIRHLDGRQAGSLRTSSDQTIVVPKDGVEYLSSTEAGSWANEGSGTWRFEWTAPPDGDTLLVHLAANAAGGDDSPLGDSVFVHTFTLVRAGR